MAESINDRRFKAENITRLRRPERLELLEVERVVALTLEGVKATSVLDVGTGSGVFAEAFANRRLRVVGVDVSPEMVAAASELVPTAKFEVSPAEKMPYADGAFDLVFIGMMLHEADDAQQALYEAHRIAAVRVAVLEWPDEEQPFGPPRSDRLSEEKIASMAKKARFSQVDSTRLASLVLYRLAL